MNNFHFQYQKSIKTAAISILFVLVFWLLRPGDWMAGLVFGLSLGIVNNYLLYRNVLVTTNHVHSVEDMPLRPKLDISSWRLFLVIIGFLLAYRLEGIQLLTVIIGFFYCQGLAHFYMMFDAIQESSNLE